MASNISKAADPRPLVLIADDLLEVRTSWAYELDSYGIWAVAAATREEAVIAFFGDRTRFAAIILDGCIPGNELNTIGLIETIRACGFTGPVIASSSSALYRATMMRAGCTHQAPKNEAVELVADLLSTP